MVHHHRLLRQALQQAIRWQLLARNPADAVQPPRPRRKEIRALTEDETAKLLTESKARWLYMPILIAATTGLRRGEVLAVRWADIDLEAKTLAVRRSLEQTAEGLSFKEPKTSRSRRVVALLDLTVDALRKHRTSQARERLAAGSAYLDLDLACCAGDGRPWLPSSLTHAFTTLASRIGLDGLRFHDLRHTHATQLLRQGVHPKIVSERLGHSTVGITLDVYSHVLPDMQQEAAKLVDGALRSAFKGRRYN